MLQEFSEEVEKTARAVVNEIHTALPGEVISFDGGTGTATVKPVGKFVTSDGKKLDYPTITEAPIVFPFCQQAGVGIAFPVKAGDSCIILISEVELDQWRSGAEAEGSLRFDLTNAMILPGLLKGTSALAAAAVSANGVIVQAGDSSITVSGGGIAVRGNLKVDGNISYTGVCQRS